MPRRQLVLPIPVRPRIAPLDHTRHLLIGPGVQIDGFDTRDVHAHAAVNAGAADADEDSQVPGSPARVLVALAVGALFVALEFDELFERGAVLLAFVGAGHAAGHCGWCCCGLEDQELIWV